MTLGASACVNVGAGEALLPGNELIVSLFLTGRPDDGAATRDKCESSERAIAVFHTSNKNWHKGCNMGRTRGIRQLSAKCR